MMRFLLTLTLGLGLSLGAAAFDPVSEDPGRDKKHPPAIEELAINSEGARMPGLFYLADGAGPHPTVVLLHGIPGNEKNLDIAQALRRAGFNVLFFHYRGAWGAEGDYSILTVGDDALAALAFLREPDNAARYRVKTTALSLLGHSLGGYAALSAGARDADLACVGALAPANFGALLGETPEAQAAARGFAAYADGLFMLHNFNGEQLTAQLREATPAQLDTTRFGAGLKGKQVFMIAGDADSVTPPDIAFHPVVAAYKKEPGIKLRSRVISGDHSFSWSRIALTRLLLDWYGADCR